MGVPQAHVPLLVNPLNFETPLGASGSPPCRRSASSSPDACRCGRGIGPASGCSRSPSSSRRAAACLRLYPFHGRLVLFLVPSLLLLIAEGANWFRETFGARVIWTVLLATVLLFPILCAFEQLVEPRDSRQFSPFGDRRPTKLDPYRFPF